ncbi:phosphohydrolase [Burkholderia phage BcepSaruman]|uniref:Metal dependent phosphohydrolase-like protein n=1 Tax=Burkholderia phage BcepSaruman TaxID=2530032 RepID=A0A4D5ZCF6_9CAUD|nr:phosphohydrolase [Burkholderia phage BcepSaruman]QBX06634.1 metal dependent phosphohydrolase-like protein [Burkholderia phage BcepSaruman]
MFNVDPHYEAKHIIRAAFAPDHADYLLSAMSQGLHTANPYHNVEHQLHVAYWAHVCALNENSLLAKPSNRYLVESDIKALLLAAMFHDHNHSGGVENDLVNVQRAIQRVMSRDIALIMENEGIDKNKVRNLIRVTCFHEGEFRHVPKNLLEKSIRDADLMMVYTQSGADVSTGLMYEQKGAPTGWVQRSYEFLSTAKMFTRFGQIAQAQHLKDACAAWKEQHDQIVAYNAAAGK